MDGGRHIDRNGEAGNPNQCVDETVLLANIDITGIGGSQYRTGIINARLIDKRGATNLTACDLGQVRDATALQTAVQG